MEFSFKVLKDGVASVGGAGKEFFTDADGIIKVTEDDYASVAALVKAKIIQPLESWLTEQGKSAEAAAQTEAQKIESAAQAMLKDEEFRAKVLARTAELVGTSTEESANEAAGLTIAATNAATAVAKSKKGQ
jgi:hypothetical protein